MYQKLNNLGRRILDTSSVYIVRDEHIAKAVLRIAEDIQHKAFSIKEYPHINNGQKYYHLEVPQHTKTKTDLAVMTLIELESLVRSKVATCFPGTIMEYGFTQYPVSTLGASLHKDFSYNMNCTITMFFGATSMYVVDSSDTKREYQINKGDIVIMRAPRDYTKEEIAMRPLHGIGPVAESLIAFEAREVNLERKKLIKKS